MQKMFSLSCAVLSLVPTISVAQQQSSSVAEPLAARSLDAIPQSTIADQSAQQFRALRVSGRALAERVERLESLTWHESLKQAQAAAQQSGKLILWVQMLGDLDGFA